MSVIFTLNARALLAEVRREIAVVVEGSSNYRREENKEENYSLGTLS